MKMIKAGVIGLGVGEQHVISYNKIENVEVVAICDLDPNHVDVVGQRQNVPERYTDASQVTTHPEIDVVSICSYDNYHAEQLISALNHGKHVMIEKPFVLHPSESEKVLRALTDSGKFMTSNLILRESPRFKAVRQMVQAGDFGEIFHIEGDYLHDILWKITEGWRGQMDFYCTVYGGGIHLIDLMRWIMGQEVREVCAMGNNLRSRGSIYKYPDCITALMSYESGATGKSTTSFGPRRTKFHSLNVYGDRLTFVNDIPNAKLFCGDQPEDVKVMNAPYPAMEKGDLLPEFIQAIRANEQPNVCAVDVFRIMDICFSVWESLQTGRKTTVHYLM